MKKVINVIMTGKCNANCKYCLYKNKYYPTNIDSIYIDNKEDDVEITSGISETFVNVDKLYKLTEIIRKNDNVLKQFFVFTNGITDNKNIEKFIKENSDILKIKVSLDGPKDENDKYRIDINNNGMFDRTINFIKKYNENISHICAVIGPKHDIRKCMWFLYMLCSKNNFKLNIVPCLPYKIWNKNKLLSFYFYLDKLCLLNETFSNIEISRACGDLNYYRSIHDNNKTITEIPKLSYKEAYFSDDNWNQPLDKNKNKS